MVIQIEDAALRGLQLTESQALLDFAVGLFTEGGITMGRAAEIARLARLEFQKELSRRGIPIHYDVEDLHADMITLSQLREK